MKKFLLVIVAIFISCIVQSQIKMGSGGNISFGTTTIYTSYRTFTNGYARIAGVCIPSYLTVDNYAGIGTSWNGPYRLRIATGYYGTHSIWADGKIAVAGVDLTSDKKLKKNINKIQGIEVITKLSKIEGTTFEFLDTSELASL